MSSTPRTLGYNPVLGCTVQMLDLDSVAPPAAFGLRDGEKFTCFCAMDARGTDTRTIANFCSILLSLGCAYFCTWGPDCERVHDIMDRQVIGENPPDTYLGCVMTTWHENDSLEEALNFFLTCTEPVEDFAPAGCGAALIISIGSKDWPASIERYVKSKTIPELTWPEV